MTEINNPKKYCNDSQSGSQQLPPNLCNCTPNIIAGPNIALTPNEDGSVTISAVVTDTDTRLGNPHTCAGAPAGYTRFCYDLINVISGATISADFSYIDVPLETQTTLDSFAVNGTNIEIIYTGENGLPQTKSLPICNIVSAIPDADLVNQTCLDQTPGAPVASHGITRTDSNSDTFVEITHNDGFGVPSSIQFPKYKTASGVIFTGGGAATGNTGDFWLDNSMQFNVNNVFGYNTEMNFTVRIELDTNDTPSSLDLASVGFGVVNQTTGIPNGVDAIGDYGWQLYSPDQVNLSAHKYTYVGSANLTLLPGNNTLIMYMRISTESGNPYQFTFGPHKLVWFSYLTHA